MTANDNHIDQRFRSSFSTGAISPKDGFVPPPPPRRRSSSGARVSNPPPSKPSPIAPSSDDSLINETTEITSGLVSKAKAWLNILELKSQSQSLTTDAAGIAKEEQLPMTTRYTPLTNAEIFKGNAPRPKPDNTDEVWSQIHDLQHSILETRSMTSKCNANLDDMKSECWRIANWIDLLDRKAKLEKEEKDNRNSNNK